VVFKAVLVLGAGDQAVGIFYALLGRPVRRHQNNLASLALLLIRQRDVDEIRANDVSRSAGGGLLDNLNLHVALLNGSNFGFCAKTCSLAWGYRRWSSETSTSHGLRVPFFFVFFLPFTVLLLPSTVS
jgi:hypothetical protein